MESRNFQRYGVPLYGASWVPRAALQSTVDDSSTVETPTSTSPEYLVLSGGGGEGNSGIPNALLLTEFDRSVNSLSDEPVVRHGTGADLPYRMAVHPRGEGVICSFPDSCRWFDWENGENGRLGLKSSDRVLTELKDVGQQLAFAFSEDGSLLAAGGEDGKLRVFKWPSMEILVNDGEAYKVVKDLHFSIDGKYLVTLGSGGPCRVWDVLTSTVVATLAKENDEIFRFCRFSQRSDGDQVLCIVAFQGKGVNIISWRTDTWKRMSSKQIVRDSVTAFDVSVDGKLIAVGTNEGGILILDSSNMKLQMTLKKAHIGLVTALAFSHDSRALGSVSMDSSVRVTAVQDRTPKGFNNWIILLIIILALAAYFWKNKGSATEIFHFSH
ncbi:hypothetical protein RND81_03G192100 [Saponaria officinalis]|uniref:Anaphase-promoting complex subunit 4-like WD40 domain-containing protein n=1 Tax=Saponaria officinalis TaxID=3572 RepID=A0AAW1M7E9_SAPOF